jgi:hypothetical protein
MNGLKYILKCNSKVLEKFIESILRYLNLKLLIFAAKLDYRIDGNIVGCA